MKTFSFTVASELPIKTGGFLGPLTLEHVNWELWPLVRMTAPAPWLDKPLLQWPTGQILFTSWVLLLGILPIDRHRFYLDAVDPAVGFAENSNTWTNRQWQHVRKLENTAEGCRITDTLHFQCRLSLLGHVLKPVYQWVFEHRHRRLRRRYHAIA